MATTDITSRFTNQQKRTAEALTIAFPSMLSEGGGRNGAAPVYLVGGDAYTAQVIEPDTIVKKVYVQIDEAFPAGALLNVNIAGTDFIVAADGTATGMVVSTEEDHFFANGQTVTISVAGVTGNITTGLARVFLDTVSTELKNGNYAT